MVISKTSTVYSADMLIKVDSTHVKVLKPITIGTNVELNVSSTVYSKPSGPDNGKFYTVTEAITTILDKTKVMSGATASSDGTSGIVPQPEQGDENSFLRGDGTWAVPTNTTYNVFSGATVSSNGSSGLVPQPKSSDYGKVLYADGTWSQIPTATSTGLGLVKGDGSAVNSTYTALAISSGLVYEKNMYKYVTSGTSDTVYDTVALDGLIIQEI